MSDLAFSIIAALVVASLVALIVVTVVMLRRADARVKVLVDAATRRRGPAITTDEMIDLHLALKDINNLREISDRIPA